MSNLTTYGKSFVPPTINVPFERTDLVFSAPELNCDSGPCKIIHYHLDAKTGEWLPVWEKLIPSFSQKYGDTIKLDGFRALIPVNVNFDQDPPDLATFTPEYREAK